MLICGATSLHVVIAALPSLADHARTGHGPSSIFRLALLGLRAPVRGSNGGGGDSGGGDGGKGNGGGGDGEEGEGEGVAMEADEREVKREEGGRRSGRKGG